MNGSGENNDQTVQPLGKFLKNLRKCNYVVKNVVTYLFFLIVSNNFDLCRMFVYYTPRSPTQPQNQQNGFFLKWAGIENSENQKLLKNKGFRVATTSSGRRKHTHIRLTDNMITVANSQWIQAAQDVTRGGVWWEKSTSSS